MVALEEKKIGPFISKWSKPIMNETGEFVNIVRERGPGAYLIKIESFSTLKHMHFNTGYKKDYIELGNFSSGERFWGLYLYPNGNKKENGENHISLYLKLIRDIEGSKEVIVTFNFFIYDQLRDNYLMIQGIKEKRFHAAQKKWGLSRVISLEDFCEASNGFLKDDACSFGVEVIFSASIKTKVVTFPTKELRSYNFTCQITNFSKLRQIPKFSKLWQIPKFSKLWQIPKFSKLQNPRRYSPALDFNRRSWKLSLMYVNGGESTSPCGLCLYLYLDFNSCKSNLTQGDKLLASFEMCIKNQNQGKDIKLKRCAWFHSSENEWGSSNVIPKTSLGDFLKNDTMIVEVNVKEFALIKAI